MIAEAPGRPSRFVAASIGPYGAMLADGSEYRGRYGRTVAELRDFHRDRLRILAATDADVLAVETIPEVEEAAAVAELLAETAGAAAWVSFSCADGRRIRSGAPIEEAVGAVASTPAVLAVGVNCTAPEHVPELVDADRRGDRRCRSSCTRTAARRGTRPAGRGPATRARASTARRPGLGRRAARGSSAGAAG